MWSFESVDTKFLGLRKKCILIFINTVKPAQDVTSIKQPPVLKDHLLLVQS